MATYTDEVSFSLRPLFKLKIEVEVTGTSATMKASAIRTGSENRTPFGDPGGTPTRGYSFTNSSAPTSASGVNWVFDFRPAGSNSSSNPFSVDVWGNGVTRTLSATSTVTASAFHPDMGTATASVSVPIATVPAPVISGTFSNGTVGVSYTGSVTATESPTSWSRTGNLPAGLTGSGSGDTYTVTGTPTTAGTTNFTLKATNDGGSDSEALSITIDSPPNPSWDDTGVFTEGKVNQGYYETRTASDTSSITDASTTAPGLSTSTSGGNTLILQGTPTSAGTFTVTAKANGASGTTASTLSTTVKINPLVLPTWSDTSLSNDFRVGVSYASSSGGNNSVSANDATSFTLQSGSFPTGISGSRSGTTYTLSGTPTTRGPYSFTLRASNTDGNASPDQTFSGNVTHPPLWTDETLAAFSQGRSYSDSLTVSTSTAVSWSISSGSLPTGITATASGTNTNTYTLSGTPTGSGAYSFTITANNGDGTLSKTFSGNILLVPNWIDNTLGNFVNNVEYSDSVSATNSPTYSVTVGSLPAGITLNSSTGLVSGTPTGAVGTAYSFTIRALNASGNITQAFSGTIQPDLGGGVKLFDGTAWNNKEVYVYNGTSWVLGRLYIYSGTAWIKSVY